jgi:hypothetical protein
MSFFSKLNKDFKLLLVLVAGMIIIASCESKEPGCYQPTTVGMVCGFQKRDTQIVKDTVSLNPLSVIDRITYRFSDSFLPSPQMVVLHEKIALRVTGDKGSSQLGIAFNQDNDSITYTFRPDTTIAVFDTITFFYTSTLHFISNNCGYNYYFNITDIKHTSNMLDSIGYIDRNVSDANKRNVQFYFKRKF